MYFCSADSRPLFRFINTFPCFHHYIENLDRYYLDPPSNVTRLTISGHEHGPIGFTEMHQALVPLRPDHVPKLRELEMGWYFIQDSFVDFLSAHGSTLEVCVPHLP